MTIDHIKIRRETLRWLCLYQLDVTRPVAMTSVALLAVVQAVYLDASIRELLRELDYLKQGEFLRVTDKDGIWHLSLTRSGIDLVEYTTPCPNGIGRPPLQKSER